MGSRKLPADLISAKDGPLVHEAQLTTSIRDHQQTPQVYPRIADQHPIALLKATIFHVVGAFFLYRLTTIAHSSMRSRDASLSINAYQEQRDA